MYMILFWYLHDLHDIHGIYMIFSILLIIFNFRTKKMAKIKTTFPENQTIFQENLKII